MMRDMALSQLQTRLDAADDRYVYILPPTEARAVRHDIKGDRAHRKQLTTADPAVVNGNLTAATTATRVPRADTRKGAGTATRGAGDRACSGWWSVGWLVLLRQNPGSPGLAGRSSSDLMSRR